MEDETESSFRGTETNPTRWGNPTCTVGRNEVPPDRSSERKREKDTEVEKFKRGSRGKKDS